MPLLTPEELDRLLRYPRGKSQRLARRDLLPHVTLPDGSIRFRKKEIEKLVGEIIADSTLRESAGEGVYAR
jgi:hypothetical protein